MKTKRHQLQYRGTSCLNCHQSLDKSEGYCHNCGQLNSTKRLTFNDFFTEFFSGIFAYDSRLYRTLRALLLKPGKISKDYIEGKRERYANPYKFYLSCSILFFIFWGMTGEFGAERTSTTPGLENLTSTKQDSVMLYQQMNFLDATLPEKTMREALLPEAEIENMDFWSSVKKKAGIFTKYYSLTEESHAATALEAMEYENSLYNRWLYDKTVDLATFDLQAFFNYLVGKLPFFIFFFLPVFALFIWLLYIRRSYTYMEHLIFTFHNQTVLFVLFGIGFFLDYAFNTSWWENIAGVVFLIYLYKAMRHFYGQGRVKTFVKFIFLNGLFCILALVAGLFSILASFAIF